MVASGSDDASVTLKGSSRNPRGSLMVTVGGRSFGVEAFAAPGVGSAK